MANTPGEIITETQHVVRTKEHHANRPAGHSGPTGDDIVIENIVADVTVIKPDGTQVSERRAIRHYPDESVVSNLPVAGEIKKPSGQ